MTNRRLRCAILAGLTFIGMLALVVSVVPLSRARAETATVVQWTRQFIARPHSVTSVAVASGVVSVADSGGFVWQYDVDGHPAATTELGEALAVDITGLYALGEGEIRRYSTGANWTPVWTRTLDEDEHGYGPVAISAYSGEVYVAGSLHLPSSSPASGEVVGVFLRKYDTAGAVVWTQKMDSSLSSTVWGLCAVPGGVYWGAYVGSPDTGADFVFRYDAGGNLVWSREVILGNYSAGAAVCADSGGAYVAGVTGWETSYGFVSKYAANDGSIVWTRQITSSQSAYASAAVAYAGGIYVAGSVRGTLTGQTSAGGDDAFVCEYDTAGNQVWGKQFGSSDDDAVTAASVSAAGLYLGGFTSGTMPNTQGTGDGFLSRLTSSQYPQQPINLSPADGTTGVALTPILQASPYSDPDGDAHAASRWQVRSSNGDYNSSVWDSGSISPTTSITVPSGKLNSATTYHWRVGYRDSRNLWSSYSLETSFTTAAATPIPPAVATVAASGIGSTSATLNLSLTSLGAASSVQVSFEWGAGTAYGNTTTPQTMNGTGSLSYSLSGLSPATTYYFRAKAEGAGTSYGNDMTFTTSSTPASPPTVTTGAATGTAADAATLNGTLNALGSVTAVQVAFEWGPTMSYGTTTPSTAMVSTGDFNAPLTGLTAGTTYHYRAKAVGDDFGYGGDMTFTTSATPTTPPALTTGDADTVTASSARLSGGLTSLGTASSVTVCFRWGTTKGGPYPNETAAAVQTATGTFRFNLTGLASGTTFYYQAKAVGHGASYGTEKSLTTAGSDGGVPVIGSLVADNGSPGDDLTVTISGSNMTGATGVAFGTDIAVNDFRVVSDTEITVKITIASGAKAGGRDITVTTPQGTGTAPGAFSVNGTGSRVHLWVYLVAVAGGLVALGMLALVAVRLRRRPVGLI